MAYGLLAGVDPVVGIYTAFFPGKFNCIAMCNYGLLAGVDPVVGICEVLPLAIR